MIHPEASCLYFDNLLLNFVSLKVTGNILQLIVVFGKISFWNWIENEPQIGTRNLN